MTMHQISDSYLDDYVDRNWDSIRHSVGCYKIEEEGVRLFSAIRATTSPFLACRFCRCWHGWELGA
jgi:predicted house-cleaning NTP pyrophosphatase (Maf/HAM1 superfamily)